MGRFSPATLIPLALLPALLVAPQLSSADGGQDDQTFRVDVRLVRVIATVKDAAGKPVGGLDKSDLTVHDNGVEQKISLFERHTAQPLSVAILLDISGSTAREMKYQTDALVRFVKTLFGEGNPEDKASLWAFNWQVSREVDWTRKAGAFGDRMRRLKAEAGTAMYDALLLSAEDLAKRDGRHVIVIVTDGGDTVSSTGFHKALEAIHSADAVVYPILTVPITNDAGRNVGGENALTTFARTTGGKVFVPATKVLDEAFSDILRDLRTQYLVGYYPQKVPLTKNRFHKIELRTKRPDLQVVSRTGYYGDAEPSSDTPRR